MALSKVKTYLFSKLQMSPRNITQKILQGWLLYTPRNNVHSLSSLMSESSNVKHHKDHVVDPDLPSLASKIKQDNVEQANPLDEPDYFGVNNLVSLKELFDARVHLGHETGCWNPYMKPYIYGTFARHHVINLNQTLKHIQRSLNVLSHIVYHKGVVLFVSTFPRFEYMIQETAREAGEYFITQRWRKGTLTNAHKLFPLIDQSFRYPDLIVFMNLNSLGVEQTALKEASMCCIPTIGIVDTDCDPRLITYTIPGNDDTDSSMQLYCRLFKEVILRAKEKQEIDMPLEL